MKVKTLNYAELLEAAREFLALGNVAVARKLIAEYWAASYQARLNRAIVSFPKSIRFGV